MLIKYCEKQDIYIIQNKMKNLTKSKELNICYTPEG